MTARTLSWLLGLLACSAAAASAAEDGQRRDEDSSSLDASALSRPPTLIRRVAPEYPTGARDQTRPVEIKLLLDVDERGQVGAAAVLEPTVPTGLGFEDAAMAAAYQLVFEPAELDGKPVAVQILYTFKFLPPKAEPVAPAASAPPAPTVEPSKPARAPVKNLAGRLRERGTRLPMAGILVTVYRDDGPAPVGFECASDPSGQFAFFDLEPGTWKVSIEAPGYYPFATTEEIRAGELTQVGYFVERTSYNPFDVLVESPRPRKEVTRVVIESDVIEKVPGAMGDALSALQNFAGVARVPAFSGEIVVRGSAPKDSKVFVDGVEIPIAYHFGGLRSVVPTGMIESLDFYPGNFSSYYGRAIGGVIDVTLKKPKAKRVSGYLDVSLLDSGFFVEAPVTPKLTLSAAGRRSYVDAILNAVVPEDAPLRMTRAPVYYDYQFLAQYRPSSAHELRLFVFGSDDTLTMVFKNAGSLGSEMNGNRLSHDTAFQRVVGSYRYVPGERFDNIVRLSYGRDGTDQVVAQFLQRIHMDSLSLRDTARLRLVPGLTLVGGVDAVMQHWTANVRMPMPPREGKDEANLDLSKTIEARADEYHWLPSAFLGVEMQLGPRLLLLPSLRVDHFSKIADTTFGPRLSARYTVAEHLTAKVGVGLYHQEPSIDESNESFGNPLLDAERAIHYAAGIEAKPLAGLSVDVTGFYKDLDHLVSETTATRTQDGREIPLRYDNRGLGRVYGMELMLRRDPVHRLSGWIAYTVSRSERQDSGTTGYRLFQHDQTHILTAVAMFRFGHNWQLSSRFRLISGRPTTPVTGAVLDLDTGNYRPTMGSKYAERNPTFAQWDLRIDKKWVFDRFLLNLYLDVQNVTNRANVEEPDYNFDYRKVEGATGLPILPILGLRAEL